MHLRCTNPAYGEPVDAAQPSIDWIDPSPADPGDGAPLRRHHVDAWRDRGAVVVQGLVPIELIDAAAAHARRRFGPSTSDGPGGFGSDGQLVFPTDCESIDDITLHPRVVAAAGQLLGTSVGELRLTQSDVWAKWGRNRPVDDPTDNDDQRIHVDYPNHMLTHPPPWGQPEAVEMIVYMDHVEACDGATAVVLRNGDADPAYRYPIIDTPGVGRYPWVNDRTQAEEVIAGIDPAAASWRTDHLYRREQRVRFAPGTVLLYRLDTWHRGTPIRPGAMRIVQNVTFRRADCEWISTVHPGWSWSAYRPSQRFERLLAQCTVDQRTVLGFPRPGHRYWTAATVEAVRRRYEPHGIDMTPYADALD
jgi:hypothetical protein